MKILTSFLGLFFLFFILSVIFTYPLVPGIDTYIPGFHSTDEPFAALWNFWWLKHIPQNKVLSLIMAPFGISSCESGYPIWNFINKCLSILTNNIFAYNTEILVSFILSGIFMYYLLKYLTRNRMCSFLSACIYAFCPYHFARAWQHLGLAQTQWMPLYILALLKLKDKPSLKYALLTAISLYLVFAFDLYYAYFMLIVAALFIIFLLAYKLKQKLREIGYLKNDLKTIKLIFISSALVFLLITPLLYMTAKNSQNYKKMQASANNPYLRPFEDLFAQSARPLSYFFPASVHPIFGKFTEKFVGSDLYGESFTEHTLYLGWAPLILAFFAFRKWKARRKSRELGTVPCGDSPSNREDFYIGFFIFLAFAAWFFSQPPWWNILGFRIYMPSFFMYKILPMFRAYCRFGIVVMLAVAVLAGYGLKYLLERFKTQKSKITITVLLCGLVMFEFWNYPPFKVIDVFRVPAVYYWLKEQPGDFIIAEYPIDTEGPNEMYKFYQATHAKKIINGTVPGSRPNQLARAITKLSEPNTALVLKSMGVKYVLVHREDYINTELIEDRKELDRIPNNRLLKFVKSFPVEECPPNGITCVQKTGPIDVYEVVAKPVKPQIQIKNQIKNSVDSKAIIGYNLY